MDIEQESKTNGQIILPEDVLPPVISIIPQEQRPFFPGQVMPLLMNTEVWLPTFKAVQDAGHDVIGIVATKGPMKDLPQAAELFDVGTVCRIHKVHKEGPQLQVLVEGLQRFNVRSWVRTESPLAASVRYLPDPNVPQHDDEIKGYAVAIINTIKELIPLNPLFGEELKMFLGRTNPNEPARLADFAASMTSASKQELQDVLEAVKLDARMQKVLELLHSERQIASAQMEIREHIENEMQTHQREAFLREQLKFIQKELGIAKDDKTAEIDAFKERLEHLSVPQAAMARIDEEMDKLSTLEVGSPEFGVTRNYLDWLTGLPWGVMSEDTGDLTKAGAVLDSHHEGLEDVKERIREFLAVGIMRGDVGGSIVLLVGPPGVGKTSLGKAVAEALGRKFYRFSVGGMRDEAEIKGHRRTYIGAMPGKLIQALKDTGRQTRSSCSTRSTRSARAYQGDPASACSRCWIPSRTTASTTTISTSTSTCPRCCSSAPPTSWTRFRARCSIAWRQFTCRDTWPRRSWPLPAST